MSDVLWGSIIWSSINGAYITKTNYEVRENGLWLHAGDNFSRFVSKDEAIELVISLGEYVGYDIVKKVKESEWWIGGRIY